MRVESLSAYYNNVVSRKSASVLAKSGLVQAWSGNADINTLRGDSKYLAMDKRPHTHSKPSHLVIWNDLVHTPFTINGCGKNYRSC